MDSLPPQAPRELIELVQSFPKMQGCALVQHGTRCGKTGCRCRRGQLHPTAYLRWREGGRQRRRYVRRADIEPVQAIVAQRHREQALERIQLQESLRVLRRLEELYRDASERGAGW